MKRTFDTRVRQCIVFVAVVVLGTSAALDARGQLTATEILRRAEDITRGETQQGTYTMRIERPDWERSMEFDYWAEGTTKAFIRVLEPVKEKGVSFLKIDREMWQYVPRINRVIKIPPSMMLQSWMGSDFTNDDLVRESNIIDDYEHSLLGEEEIEGVATYKIELIPKEHAAVAWHRLIEWIRKDNYLPVRAQYYSERGEHVRTMLFEDIREMGGRVIPARMTLVEETKEGRTTTLQMRNVRFDEPIPKRIFTQQNLRSDL